LSASSTIAFSTCKVTGSFFTAGLARECCSPSNVAFTIGCDGDGTKPTVECIHKIAGQVFSTANFDLVSSAKCCKYRTTSCGFAGMETSLWDGIHRFLLMVSASVLL